MTDKIFLEGLAVSCIIGIFDWERKKKQRVLIDFEIPAEIRKAARRDRIEDALDYKEIAHQLTGFISKSRFYLIETLAEKTAEMVLKRFKVRQIKLRVSKPGAIRGAKNVGVEIVRKRK